MNECPSMLLCHSNPPKSAQKGGTVVPPSNFQFVTTKGIMIQTLTSLSSHGYAQAHARQILYMLSWLPVANNCSSKCPSKHLTALTQALANTQQSSSLLANYCPIKMDGVLLTTYLTAFHVYACTPLATIKSPSKSRQTTKQRHYNVMPTTAKRTVSTPKTTAKNLVIVLYAAVLQLPYNCQTPRHRPVCSCVTAAMHPTYSPQRTLCEPSTILSVTCNSLAIHLPYNCATIA
mgnify:CR=1 FL=1